MQLSQQLHRQNLSLSALNFWHTWLHIKTIYSVFSVFVSMLIEMRDYMNGLHPFIKASHWNIYASKSAADWKSQATKIQLPKHSNLWFLGSNYNIQHPFHQQILAKTAICGGPAAPLLLNLEQITVCCLFVWQQGVRFVSALCTSTQFVNLVLSARLCVSLCVVSRGNKYACVHKYVCVHAEEQWMLMWQDNKVIHVVGLHNNICVEVCPTKRSYIALGWFCKCRKMGIRGPGRGHS